MCAIKDTEDGATGELERLNKTITILINFLRMKRKLLFLMVMLAGLFANAQDASVLDIEGLEVTPEETATKTYFIRNVGTGLFMSYGGAWSTNVIETSAAHPIALETNGEYVAIGSLMGYMNSNGMWFDHKKETSKWMLVKVDGFVNQYYIQNEHGQVISSEGSAAGVLSQTPKKGVDGNSIALQRWVFLTEEDLRNEMMPAASAESPLDVTPLVKGATFDIVDTHKDAASIAENPNAENPDIMEGLMPYDASWENDSVYRRWVWDCKTGDWDPASYNTCRSYWAGEAERVVTQRITLPAGTYHFSFEGFYSCVKTEQTWNETKSSRTGSWTSANDTTVTNSMATMAASVSVGGVTTDIQQGGETEFNNSDNGGAIAAKFRDSDDYKQHGTFYIAEETEVEFVVTIGALTPWSQTTEVTGQGGSLIKYDNARKVTNTWYTAQVFVDEFRLTYYGADELAHENISHTAHYKEYIEANIEEMTNMFGTEAQAEFNSIVSGIDVDAIENEDGYAEAIRVLNSAYDAAKIVQDQNTGLLVNASFEMGNLTGWTVRNGQELYGDVNVYPNSNGTYTTTGVDGNYLFNCWWNGFLISQKVSGLPNGRYKLEVLVAGGDDGNDGTVYLVGNDEKLGVNPPSGGKTFGDYGLRFNVTDGTATVGVIGGNDDDTAENPIGSYSETGYWWYKCDDFRLTYLGEILDMQENSTTLDYEEGEFIAYATVDRQISSDNWSTLLLPFDMSIPEGWTVKQLTDDTYISGSTLCLRFEDATSIEAGVPYLVRHTLGESVSLPSVDDVIMTNTVNTTSVDGCVDFSGTYTTGVIPAGAYYLSGNKFYKATTDIPTKGFRAYFMPKSAEIKSLGFDFDDVDFTGIEDVESNAAETVAIYGADGTLRSDLQKGINIVKMSDGTMKKVLVP